MGVEIMMQGGTLQEDKGMNFFQKRKLIVESPENLVFTADLHFCHSSIIRLCNRPFADIDDMNDGLIRNWREAVTDEDDIVILGDIFWQEHLADEYLAILARLPGKKHLVLGNHDYFENDWYLGAGFASVQSYLEVLIGYTRIACFHYPIREWNGFHRGALHFHGHTHGSRGGKHSAFADAEGMLDVGIDAQGYRPVRWTELAASHGWT